MLNRLGLAALMACAVLAACEEKKTPVTTTAADAAADPKAAVVDSKLEKALAAATASAQGGDKGPPPGGVFAPGAADALHAKNAPMKVEVASDGAEPRLSFLNEAGASPAIFPGSARITVSLRMGPRAALPTVEFAVAYSSKKIDGADAVVAEVKKASPSKEQMGQLPEGADKEIAKLNGSEIRIRPTNAGSPLSVVLAKGAPAELERILTAAGQVFFMAVLPPPPKPVGAGAYWMSEARMPWNGVDAVSYRAYKVKELEGQKLSLTVDARQYAAGRDLPLEGAPKGAELQQFENMARGELEFARGELVARKLRLADQMVLVLSPEGGARPQAPQQPGRNNMMTAQFETEAEFVRDAK